MNLGISECPPDLGRGMYDAPVQTVWEAWTDPDQVAQWWGPLGFTLTTHHKELRPGGIWHDTMPEPDGTAPRVLFRNTRGTSGDCQTVASRLISFFPCFDQFPGLCFASERGMSLSVGDPNLAHYFA